jgi:cell division protein FtsI (penicillin-binding protein 3)
VVIGVFIDEPKGEVYGGEIAAPVFRELTEHALKARGVPTTGALAVVAPPAPATPSDASPDRDEGVALSTVEVAPRRPAQGSGAVAVPGLQGLPARAALRRLEAADLAGDVRGSGRVTGQAPRAGEVVKRGTRVRLTLAPPG